MSRLHTHLLLGLFLVVLLACDASNPVAPEGPGGGGGGGSSGRPEYSISIDILKNDGGVVEEGFVFTSEEVFYTLQATVVEKDDPSAAPPDDTPVVFTVTLGFFTKGPPVVQEQTQGLRSGVATARWAPGVEVGAAQVLVGVGNTVEVRTIQVREPDPPAPDPIAEFDCDVSGLLVLCSNASENATDWEWDFGDDCSADNCPLDDQGLPSPCLSGECSNESGTCPECFEREPLHEYAVPDTYGIRLTAINEAGERDSQRKLVVVGSQPEPPEAKFSFTPGSGLTVIFSDESTGPPTSWLWDFGDGATSTERNPSHEFPAKDEYLVSLSVSNSAGSNDTSQFVDVGAAIPELKADFTFSVSESGLIVTFTDTSVGEPTNWSWDFGDGCAAGNADSCPNADGCPECTEQNPIHTFVSQGEYQVKLTVGDEGQATSTAQKLVAAGAPPPVANFDWTPKNAVGLRILFEDLSENTPTEWKWDFNDGCCAEPPCSAPAVPVPTCDPGTLPGSCPECTDKNPVHDYRFSGDYGVKLIVANTGGSDDTTKLVAVDSGEEFPEARFTYEKLGGLTVDFRDASLGPPTSWLWNFDDPGSGSENTSTNANPIHTFSEERDFTVVLTVANGEGQSTTSRVVRFLAPVADFSYRQVGTEAIFTDESTGGPTQWEWTFEGCASCPQTSTDQNPTFDFGAPGTYDVTLKVTTAPPDSLSAEVTKAVTINP